MVGKREAALERARRDPAIDVIIALPLLGLFLLAAGDQQHVLLRGDVDLVGLEPGNRKLDAELIVAELDEVERPVEADGGPPIGRKVESTTHSLVLHLSDQAERYAACGADRPVTGPHM